MKYERPRTIVKGFAGTKTASQKVMIPMSFCAVLGTVILALLLFVFAVKPIKALTAPPDGYAYDISCIDNLENLQSYEGIICTDKANKEFVISYEEGLDTNGFVTLARISQTHSLKGYTFYVSLGGSVTLDVKYDGGGEPISDGSFFGIGSDVYPFKGNIIVGGSADTAIAIGENSWRFLFNNISNEASITANGNYRLYSSYVNQAGSPQGENSFVFCRTLTVTEQNGALDISGFRFGAATETGHSGGLVSGDGATGVFAGTVRKTATADTFSVDLSNCLTSGTYVVESSDEDAGGLIGRIEEGVVATIGLPDELNCEAKSGSSQKNAGVLIGSNFGTVTIEGGINRTENTPMKFSGKAEATGSAGVIGANQDGSQAVFSEDIIIQNLNASGLRAGGIAGTCKGPFNVQNATVTDSVFTKISSIDNGRLGGALGSIDRTNVQGVNIADGCTVQILNNTFSSTDACYIGGFAGFLATDGTTVDKVIINNTTITGSQNLSDKIGGFIGYLTTTGDFSVVLGNQNSVFTFNNIYGICGGVIGEINSELQNTVVISGDGVSDGQIESKFTNQTSAIVGGLVGKTTGYLKLDGLSVNNVINRYDLAADLLGNLASGAVLEAEDISVYEKNGSVLVGRTESGSAVRFCGTIKDTSSSALNLVYQQVDSLIYRDTGFSRTGKACANNDIGNYGQVFNNEVLNVIQLDPVTHVVSVDNPIDASGEVNLTSRADFAKLAITFYTKGTVSGVTNATYAELFGKVINLTADVSLDGTGIEQLIPANVTTPFIGTFNGGDNTVTLAIGQSVTDTLGSCSGVKVGTNNARKYPSLFSCLKNATISNLKIDGQVNIDLRDAEQYIGSIAGLASGGTLTLENCDVNTAIVFNDGTVKNNPYIYIGGMVGKIDNVTTFLANGCLLNANITDNSSYSTAKLYLGGLAGYAYYTGTGEINFQNNIIQTEITKAGSPSNLQMGGFIGVLKCKSYVTANFAGTTANGVVLTATGATGSTGGILGYTFDKCRVNLNKPFSGTITAGRASLGGLLYNVNGRLTVEGDFALTGSTITSTGTERGLLLADGKNAIVTIKSQADGFDGVTASGFDLFVGENIEQYTTVDVAASGGIVTVETSDNIGVLPAQSSKWYDLIEARPNTKTRYYFNVAELENKADASETITKPEDLIYWNVYDYAKDSQILSEAKTEFLHTAVNNIVSVTADIDMTDYCFYPTKKESVTVDFKGYSLTLGVTYASSTNQFFGLQSGLLSDVTASGVTSSVVIRDIKLCGTAVSLGNSRGSGALICATVFGSQEESNRYYVNLTLADVVLGGIRIDTDAAYRPMLVNRIGSYVNASVSGISQTTADYSGVTAAASSLFGKGGIVENFTPSSDVKMTLSNIVLDGHKDSTVFTKATLFYDVQYAIGTGSFVYNFNLAEDWTAPLHQVTYGAELYLNKDQRTYFDKDYPVRPDYEPNAGTTEFYEFHNYYLPYVFTGYDAGNEKTNVNLSVNRKSTDLTEGYGTYANPYIIRSAKQLEDVCKWLSGNVSFNDGWKINFPRGNWGDVSTLDLTDYYCVEAEGGKLYRSDDKAVELNSSVLLSYLSGAYYQLADGSNLKLSLEYSGLGSTVYPFHGVIDGNGCTVYMTSPEAAIGANGYGFINVANGCAVYNLTISYENVVLSSGSFSSGTDVPLTSGPNDTSLSTGIPHFGGAIAWIVGGDNLLDTVTVTADAVTPGASHTVCGGYVGLISGGGVLFDNLTAATDGIFNKGTHLYHNNYVGRVLNGYALAVDGNTYNNTKVLTGFDSNPIGDFKIPTIAKSVVTDHNSGYSGNIFTLNTNEDLLLLSYGLNCGAFTGENGYAYGETSLSRYGNYHNIGGATEGIIDGRYTDDTNHTSILASYFGINMPTDLRSNNLTVKLAGTEYDMENYGNAFRAMSGVYEKSPKYKIVYFGSETTTTIRVNMDMLQYANYNSTSKFYDDEKDIIRCYGLFGYLESNVEFRNVNLTGKISLLRITTDNQPIATDKFTSLTIGDSRSVGGLVGRMKAAVTLTDVSLKDIYIASPDIAGGFVGCQEGNFTLNNGETGDIRNATIKGKRHTGGAVGYVASSTVTITGLKTVDSVIETRLKGPDAASGSSHGGTGGIVGYAASGTVSITNCTVEKTAIVFYANFKSSSSNVASGGIIGLSKSGFAADGCTVDGCVILSLANFGGSLFPYEVNITDTEIESILPTNLRTNLIYKEADRRADKVLASLLKQTASTSNYSIGSTGGIIGSSQSTVTLTDCTVKSDAAPAFFASYNNTGGMIGEIRSTGAITVTGCTVTTGQHDMYIIGDTRTAGIIAYRGTGGTPTYTIKDVRIEGTAENPVRILTVIFSNTQQAHSGGIIGDLNNANFTLTGAKVSNCIISGVKAGGVISAFNLGTANMTNIHVENNLIYGMATNMFAGGLISDLGYAASNSGTLNVNGAYIGNNYITSLNSAGGVAGSVLGKYILSAKYVILDNNSIRQLKDRYTSNFTFAASPLAGNAAVNALVKSTGFTNTGLIAGKNLGTVTSVAVSCYAPDSTERGNFGAGSVTDGTAVVYSAYGANAAYTGYSTVADSDPTPQQVAIEAMNDSFMIDGNTTTLYGDSITLGTPQILDAIADWYPYKGLNLPVSTTIALLGDKVSGITTNESLQLLCLNGETDITMKSYLGMLTGLGFESAVSRDLVSVSSNRYSVDEQGNLTKLEGNGSVVYNGDKFTVGVYDNLEGDTKTLTILSLTFKDANKNDTYTMHIPIYYQRSVNMKTFVVPVEGEQYYLPSFLNFSSEPVGSLRTNVSFGSPFTVYVEYDYDDMAMKIEGMNFNKRIELTQSNGVSDDSARIESGTSFILIDLNSQTPEGYSYYTMTLTEGKRFIDFNSFKNGDVGFEHINLTALESLVLSAQKRVCKDTGVNGCVYTERYLLVVFPIQNNTDSAMTYNMKAVIDEQQRESTNIVVNRLKEVYGQVSVWGSPEVQNTAQYVDGIATSTQFSDDAGYPIKMTINTNVEFPNGYVNAMTSQGSALYGTHIIRLRDSSNNYVQLPMRTVVTVTTENGDTVYHSELSDATSQIRFLAGDILKKVVNNSVEMRYLVTLDFSEVNHNDFSNTFLQTGNNTFTLVDSFYLSGNQDLLGNNPVDAFKEYTVKLNTAIKLSVVPKDNRYLGINLLKPDDVTNSGIIEFSVNAKIDTFADKNFENMSISFSVRKKVYNAGHYEYVDLDPSQTSLWQVYKGDEPISSDVINLVNNEGSDDYRLVVTPDSEDPEITSYRLIVNAAATADVTSLEANDYFVFLVCEIETQTK